MSEASGKKARKRKKWPIAVGVVAAIAVVGLVVIPSVRPSMGMAATAYRQYDVQPGSIVNTVVGSGTLEYGDAVDIKIPTGIKIDEVLVEEGDHVQSGQTLATIDMTSVQTKLADVQEQLNDLDGEINDTKDDTQPSVIKSHVGGRVKLINATEGSEAADIMVESGSLMTISIDGKMAVDFESSVSLSSGGKVDVILPDGSTKEGTVKGQMNGIYTVNLTDNGPKVGDAVTIQDDGGNTIGEGMLYINNPITIAGTGGTIDTVHVEENDSVSVGAKLVTLDTAAASAEHIGLQGERAELMETYTILISLSQSGAITADRSGTIDAVNVSDGTTAAVSAQSSNNSSSQASSDAAQSQANQSQMSGMGVYASAAATGGASSMQLMSTNLGSTISLQSEIPQTELQTEPQTTASISDLNGLALAAPVTGGVPQTVIDGQPAYTGTSQWLPVDTMFAGDTAYTAAISLTANAGYQFSAGIVPAIEGATITNIVISADTEGNMLTFNATYPKTAADMSAIQPDTGGPGDYGSMQGGGSYSGSYSGLTDSSAYTASTDQSATATDTSGGETIAFTIATDEEMVLAINVDELDILSVTEGMEASIVFDAMESETYEGVIRSVADAAGSSSGVSKYTAKIYIPRDGRMRAGMNATATIVIQQLDSVLTIPVDALQERGETVFVYTQLDPETNLPGGEVEVTTGLSDGETVEITSGLSAGDAIYYMPNTGEDDSLSMMFGGGGGNGGAMPFGG